MKGNMTVLKNSISPLIVAVIAVLAFVRGKWLLPLLLLTFAVWGLYLWKQFPHMKRRTPRRPHCDSWPDATNDSEKLNSVMQTLLRHVNYRVSAAIRNTYPNANWEWAMEHPEMLAAEGGRGRIRVYGIPNHDYAEVTLDKYATLQCSLLQNAAPDPIEAQPPNQQTVNPQVWFGTQGKSLLRSVMNDLNSRCHSKLFLKEGGDVCIQPVPGGEDVSQCTLRNFPDAAYWPLLVEAMVKSGLNATLLQDRIQVTW